MSVRRHPLLTIIVAAVLILSVVSFSRSFEASDTLSRIQRVIPQGENSGFDYNDHKHEKDAADALLGEEKNYEKDTKIMNQYHEEQEHEYITKNEKIESPKTEKGEKTLSEIEKVSGTPSKNDHKSEDYSVGKPIMAKMANQTIRAEVGRAGWKMIHTILAQYPEEPTEEDRMTLSTYLKLLSRVYPCRECAEHFQELLKLYPPQLSSRKAAVMWGCDAHNKVNKRLGKEIFDCAYIFDKYDCGCGDQEDESTDNAKEKH